MILNTVVSTDYLTSTSIDFNDQGDFALIGTAGINGSLGVYNLNDIEISSNSSSTFLINITSTNYCIGLPSYLNNSIYNSSLGLYTSNFNCIVNKSLLNEGINIMNFTLINNNNYSINTNISFKIYSDSTMPQIHFNWWDTVGFNTSSNSTYPLKLPDYHNLTKENDIFYAPNDIIHIAVNVTDNSIYYSNISRVYALFNNINLSPTSTCKDSIALTLNTTSNLWEGNCSLGNFSSELDALMGVEGPVHTGFIKYQFYDSYNNTNFFNYYNSSNSSEPCFSASPSCIPLMVPVNLHNFGKIQLNDSCIKIGDNSTNLNLVDNFNNFNLSLPINVNLSCYLASPLLPSSFLNLVQLTITWRRIHIIF